MTLLLPVYRATVYAPKSVDASEQTVLTPIAGASHGDAFRIATSEGVAGYKSYMGMPAGRRGRMDPLSKKTDIGELTFDVLDARVTPGGFNSVRWVTAFIGDNKGTIRFTRLRCFIEESLYSLIVGSGGNGTYAATGTTTWTNSSEVGRNVDFYDANLNLILAAKVTANTATALTFSGNATGAIYAQVWSPYYTGRIRMLGLKSNSRTVMACAVRDMGEDLTYAIFNGRPHGSVYQTTERVVAGTQSSTTLQDTTQAWAIDQWKGTPVTLTKNAGAGQRRTIVSNTATTLTISPAWTVTPVDATTFYSFGYVQLVSVSPVGFVYPYGGVDQNNRPLVPVTKKLDGKIGTVDAVNGWAQLNLDKAGPSWIENILNSSLFAGVAPTTVVLSASANLPVINTTLPPVFTGVAIARVTVKATGAEGDFQVGFIIHEQVANFILGLQIAKSQIVGLAIRPVSYPIGVATGTPQANGAQGAAPSAATSSVATKGWTINVTGIVKAGDLLSFSGHAQRYLVVSAANSDGSGNSTMTLKPGLQSAVANSEAITVQASPARMAIPATGTAVSWSITCDMPLADGGNQQPVLDSRGKDTGQKRFMPGNLLLVNDVHPAQVLRDAVRGAFGRLYQPTYDASSNPTTYLPPGKNLGDSWNPIPVMDADPIGDGRHGFAALTADATFPSFRCIIDKQMPLHDFVEKYICQQYGIGYYFDQSGNFVPVDLRQPAGPVPGIVTITDADLVDNTAVNWSYDATAGIAMGAYTVYAEAILQPIAAKLQVGDALPTITTKMFNVQGGTINDLTLGNPDLSQKQYQVDAHGYRAMPNEVGFSWLNGANANQQSRWMLIQQAIVDMANRTVKRPYGNGVATATFTARRDSANAASIYQGSFFLLNAAANVDPSTNTRQTVARFMLCTERVEQGATAKFTAIDWGVSSQAAVPVTVGTPAQLSGDTAHSMTSVITLNASNEMAELHYNVTTTAVGARPADTDPNWLFATYVPVSGTTVVIRGLPTGTRVWVRARTNPQADRSTPGQDPAVSALKIPSAWRYPSSTGGTDSVDLVAMAAPSRLAASSFTATSFVFGWTPDGTALGLESGAGAYLLEDGSGVLLVEAPSQRTVEVWLAQPVTEARQRIAQLSAGSNRFLINGLSAAHTYRVAVREIDGAGGFGEATLDAATTSTIPVIQPPINIRGGKLLI